MGMADDGSVAGATVFLTSVIPQIGHLPGPCSLMWLCIGHTYSSLVTVALLLAASVVAVASLASDAGSCIALLRSQAVSKSVATIDADSHNAIRRQAVEVVSFMGIPDKT
jgi:hypothetical protein